MTQERYQEAAEWLERESTRLSNESIMLDGTVIDEGRQRRAELADLATEVLSRLAARELAEQLALIVNTDYYGHHYFDDRIVDKLILPLIRDQARWQAMRELLVAVDWNYGDPPMAIAAFRLHADRVMAGPAGADAIADAAIDKARLTSPPPSQAAIPTTGD